MDLQLTDKVIIITGAAGTIGAASARTFLQEGASVVLADIDSTRGAALATELAAGLAASVVFLPLDLRDEQSIRALVSATLQKFSRIDTVVNNAATFLFQPLTRWPSMAALDQHYEVGLKGAVRLLQEVWQQYPPARAGSVVNISSIAGHVGEPDAFAYTPIKAALKGLTLSCAMEMAAAGGWAVTVSPGHTWSTPHQQRAAADGLSREQYEQVMANIQSTLFGRFLEPEEVARWIVLVASPLGKPLSGQDIRVTRGIESGGVNRQYQTTPVNGRKS
jgi:dihydroanticapsin dehydrogenase